MSATTEEIAAENAMYDRLTNTVTESLMTLPTKDLNQWNFRAMLFKQVDKIIADVLESGKGRPQISRFYLCLLLYRIVARLLDPIDKQDCGQSDRSFARQAMERIEQQAAEARSRVTVASVGAGSVRPSAAQEQLDKLRLQARDRQRKRRARIKAAKGS